jgi:CubicO group peptidase (beta-lactamase class C family)
VAPGFEGVRSEFERNFSERGDVGAAFAAVLDGRVVVDLWGGFADRDAGVDWSEDTLTVVFSGTKALVAVCLLRLVEQGRLDPDAPVVDYWPEFGQEGKHDVLVSHVVSHRAGLPGLRTPLTFADIPDDRRMGQLVAQQAPFWRAGTQACYHPFTYGWMCGELVRRIDGRSIGAFFAEEVARPLGLEIWIGLPEEHERRVSKLCRADEPAPAAPTCDQELAWAIDQNPPLLAGEPTVWNSRAYHAAEIPGAGGIATARSMARLYGCLSRGGELDGVILLAPETLAAACRPLAAGADPCFGWPFAFGFGFALQNELYELGPPDDAFGHGGAGGSIHGAWPAERVGFSYCMNEMREDLGRSESLLRALHRAVTA